MRGRLSSVIAGLARAKIYLTLFSGQQNARHYAWRDYGSRIGHWRLFEILDELKLPATILLNSSVCYS